MIREAVLQGLGIAAVSNVEYVPAPNLHKVSISDADIFTSAHALCLAERRDMRMVSAFFDTLAPARASEGRRRKA